MVYRWNRCSHLNSRCTNRTSTGGAIERSVRQKNGPTHNFPRTVRGEHNTIRRQAWVSFSIAAGTGQFGEVHRLIGWELGSVVRIAEASVDVDGRWERLKFRTGYLIERHRRYDVALTGESPGRRWVFGGGSGRSRPMALFPLRG